MKLIKQCPTSLNTTQQLGLLMAIHDAFVIWLQSTITRITSIILDRSPHVSLQ